MPNRSIEFESEREFHKLYCENPENLFIATGFSGHGIMHAPATGLAISELILTNRFQTIDLTRFGPSRILERKPYRESGII